MTKALTTAIFIERAILVHGDRYDYSETKYVKSSTKVIIICKTHGKFRQTPNHHQNGKGCGRCSGRGKTTLDFIMKSTSIHGNHYDYSKSNYTNYTTPVVIICPFHQEFEQLPIVHETGSGCPRCSGKGKGTLDFVRDAIRVHGSRFGYEQVEYKDSKSKIIITCSIHGHFTQSPSNHLSGFGCAKCSNNVKLCIDEFITQAITVHGSKYNYDNVDYVNNHTKVHIECGQHGKFYQRPSSHLSGHGCAKCGGSYPLTTEQFIQRSIVVHGDRYDYSQVDYKTISDDVIIRCQIHGLFNQSPSNHLQGKNCSKCSSCSFSKPQIRWLEFLEKLYNIHIQHMGNSGKEQSIKTTKWKADGYCKATNTVYEFHGDFWHGNPKRYDPEFVNAINKLKMKTLYSRTIKREQKIRDLKYNLVVMWESDWISINKSIRVIQRKFKSKK